MELMPTTPRFASSAEAKTLTHLLAQAKAGDVVTYAQMSAAIGRDVRQNAASALHTARKTLQRENRMVFDPVTNVGLKRLTDAEIVKLSARSRDRVRRESTRVVRKLVCVDFDRMTPEQQTQHNTAVSLFSAIAEFSSNRSVQRLTAAVQASGTELTSAKASLAALGISVPTNTAA